MVYQNGKLVDAHKSFQQNHIKDGDQLEIFPTLKGGMNKKNNKETTETTTTNTTTTLASKNCQQ